MPASIRSAHSLYTRTLFALSATLLLTTSAGAQTWTNFTSTALGGANWSTAGNWSPGLPDFVTSPSTTILTFGPGLPLSAPFQPTGNYFSTIDQATTVNVNQLIFNNQGSPDATTFGVTIQANNAAGTLAFSGSNAAIIQNGAGSITLANGSPSVDYTMSGPLAINGSGNGHITIAGVIGGSGGLLINPTAAAPLSMGSLITLSNANTFTGSTTLTSGNLQLGNATALGSGNTLIVNGGTLRVSAALTIANPMTLNSQLYVTGANAPTFTGAIGGNGGILWQPFTVGTIATFQGAISGTGTLASSGLLPQITLSGAGTALNAANYNFNLAVLSLDNSTTNLQRLNPAANMAFLSSSLTMTGNAGGATNESLSSMTLGGNGQFTLTPNAAQPMSLTIGTLNRTAGDTFQVTTQGAVTLGGTPGTLGNANLKFNNLSPANNVNGVLPFGFALIGTGATGAATMVRYDASNGVVPLNLTTDYATTHPYLVGNSPTTNLRLVSSALAGTYTFGAVNNNITVNSLLMETPTASPLFGASLFGSGTLTVNSGTIVASLVGGTTAPTMSQPFIGMNLAFGSATGYVHAQAPLNIQGNITGTGGLVKTGTGLMVINGDNSGLTGGLTINAGNVFFANDNNLGAPGAAINFNGIGQGGGGLLNFIPTNQYGPASNSSIVINRPFNLGDAGGGVAVSQTGSTMEISGNITGTGRFYKLGAGNLVLSGNNTFTGELVIFSNTVAVTSAAAIGNGSTVILNSGTGTFFQNNASFSTNKNFLIVGTTAGTALVTNEADLTISGQIGGNVTGTPLIKAGSGTLTLTNTNLVNGSFTTGDTTAVHRSGSDFAQTGGSLFLSGPNGSINQSTSYIFNQGTTVLLDNSGAAGNINNNRLSSSQVTMNGAELVLRGNANGQVAEHVGRGTAGTGLVANSLGNTITVEQPASGGGQNTNLVFTSYNNPAITTATLTYFRGTNLGATSGDFGNIQFVQAPTLTGTSGAIIATGVYGASTTASPSDFATIDANNRVIPLPAGSYTALPNTGGATTTTHIQTGAGLTLVGPVASNALKINGSTIDLGGNNLSITGTGQLLSTGNTNVDAITSANPAGLVFTGAAAKITVANSLDIGSAAAPVNITTANGLLKFGPGDLRLSNATGVTGGGYTIAQGSITLLAPNALTNTQAVTLQPGATLDIGGFGTAATPVTTGNLVGFGTVKMGSGALATGNASASVAFGGSLEGTVNSTFQKVGTATLTMNGNSPNFSGAVQILNGTLLVDSNVRPSISARPGPFGAGTSAVQIGNTTGTSTAALSLGANLNRFERDIVVPTGVPNSTVFSLVMATGQYATVTGNISLGRELRLNGPISSTGDPAGAVTFTGNITETGAGLGSFDVFGGNFNFWGNNSYSGRTFFESSLGNVMGIGTDTAFGTGPMIIANQSFTATFRADFGARIIANPFNWETGTVANSVGFTGTNDMTFTSPTVDLAGATRTFNVLSTGTTTFTGNMINGSATSALIKAGGGTLVLSGASNYVGATTLNAGVLGFGSNSVGTTSGPIGVGAFNLNGGTLRAVGGARTVNNNITVGGDFAVDGANDLTLGGTVALGAATRTVVVSNTGTTTFAGNVSSLTSGVGLTKDGNGLLVLAGTTNSIVGFTTVNRGELRVNGTIDSSGTGVFVNSGATLSGNGTIGQNVTVNGGAILKPGSSPGILNVGGTVTMSAGAIHSFQYAGPVTSQAYDSGLSATPGAGAGANNHLTITGNYTVDPNAIFKVNGNMADYTLNQPYSFRVASVTGTINGGAGFNITNPAQFDFSNFAGFAGATNLQWHNVGSVAYFNFTPVPEPLHILLVAGVGAAGFRWVRSRRQGAKA